MKSIQQFLMRKYVPSVASTAGWRKEGDSLSSSSSPASPPHRVPQIDRSRFVVRPLAHVQSFIRSVNAECFLLKQVGCFAVTRDLLQHSVPKDATEGKWPSNELDIDVSLITASAMVLTEGEGQCLCAMIAASQFNPKMLRVSSSSLALLRFATWPSVTTSLPVLSMQCLLP